MSRKPKGERPAAAPADAKRKPGVAVVAQPLIPFSLRVTKPPKRSSPDPEPGKIKIDGKVVYSLPARWRRKRTAISVEARARIVDATHLLLVLSDDDATDWWRVVETHCAIFRFSRQHLPPSFQDGERLDKALAEVIAALKPYVDNDPSFEGAEFPVMVTTLGLQWVRDWRRGKGIGERKREGGRPRDDATLSFVNAMVPLFVKAFGRKAGTTDAGPFAQFVHAMVTEANLPTLPSGPSSMRNLMKRAEEREVFFEERRKKLIAKATSARRRELA